MNTSANFEKIDAYLFGNMTPKAKQAFEEAIRADAALKEMVELQKLEHQAIELDIKADLRANLNQWKQEKFNNATVVDIATAKRPTRSIRRYLIPLSVAASLALVLTFGFLGLQDDNAAISNDYFEASSLTSRGESGEIPQPLVAGIAAFQNGNSQEAVQLLGAITDANYTDQANLLIGEIHYQDGNYELAATAFEKVLKNYQLDNTRDQAEWNLTLTFLAQKNTQSKGIRLLEAILENANHSHYPEAQKLSKQINQSWLNW